MKLYKHFFKNSYSFLVNKTILPSDNPLRFKMNLLWITVNKKIKTIDKKLEQNIALYNLETQKAKILALSSRNVDKYELLRDQNVLPEKVILSLVKHLNPARARRIRRSCYN